MIDISECCKEINEIGIRYVKAQERLLCRQEEHARILTLIDREYRTRIQELTNGKNAAITQAKSGRNARNAALDVMASRVSGLREVANIASAGQAAEILPAQNASDEIADSGFDWRGLEDMAQKITDISVMARVKGVFCSEGYAPKKQMISNFERSLDSAEQYVAEQRIRARAAAKNVEESMSAILKAETEVANNEKKRLTEEENADFNSAVSELQSTIDACKDGDAFRGIFSRIAESCEAVFGTQMSLGSVSFPEKSRERVYLGSLIANVELPDDLRAPLQKELGSFCRYPMIRVPYAIDFNRTPVLVFETSSSHRFCALSGIMSLVARKIVSSPYGETTITVIDPLGGGTSLGSFRKFAEDPAFLPLRPVLGDWQAIEEGLAGMQDDFEPSQAGSSSTNLFVVLDYPCNITEVEREGLERLLRASTEGKLSAVVLRRKGFDPPAGSERIEELLSTCPLKVVEQDNSFVLQDGENAWPIVLAAAEKVPPSYFQMLRGCKKKVFPVQVEGESDA